MGDNPSILTFFNVFHSHEHTPFMCSQYLSSAQAKPWELCMLSTAIGCFLVQIGACKADLGKEATPSCNPMAALLVQGENLYLVCWYQIEQKSRPPPPTFSWLFSVCHSARQLASDSRTSNNSFPSLQLRSLLMFYVSPHMILLIIHWFPRLKLNSQYGRYKCYFKLS